MGIPEKIDDIIKTVSYVFSESQREPAYWSRQSLNTPSPVETELDLLVMRERARRGIRNSGYDVSLTHTRIVAIGFLSLLPVVNMFKKKSSMLYSSLCFLFIYFQ